MPQPPRLSSAQSVSSFDVTDIDKGHHITNALQEHALTLHQVMLMQGVVNSSDPRCQEPLASSDEMSGVHPSSSSLWKSLRSAFISAPTFIKNLEHANAVPSQLGEDGEEQSQSRSTELDGQIAFVDDYP